MLQAICDILADTQNGLTGSEIGRMLVQLGINDPLPNHTKRFRLKEALYNKQLRDGCGNYVIAFIQVSMDPVRYQTYPELFEERRDRLNEILAFSGYYLKDDGKVIQSSKVNTLSEAQKKAKQLKRKLIDRKVHADVLTFCRAELLQDNYFHAVFEATKSVADKIRDKTGLTEDGSKLVDLAFNVKSPLLVINTLRSDTEQSEQKGLMNLIKGLFGTFRNVTAHAPKVKWKIEEQDALDLLTMVSYIHRRLDKAVFIGHYNNGV